MANAYEAPQRTGEALAWNGRIGRLRFVLQLQAMLCASFLLTVVVVASLVLVPEKLGLHSLTNFQAKLWSVGTLIGTSQLSILFCCSRRLQDLNLSPWLGLLSLPIEAVFFPRWLGIDFGAFKEIVLVLSVLAMFFVLGIALAPGRDKNKDTALKSSWNFLRFIWYFLPLALCMLVVRTFSL